MENGSWASAYWQSAGHFWLSGEAGRVGFQRRALCGARSAQIDLEPVQSKLKRCRNCARTLERAEWPALIPALEERLAPADVARARAAVARVKSRMRDGGA